MSRKIVVFFARALTHYRVPFHERVREQLAAAGVEYRVLYSAGRAGEEAKGDLVGLDWGERVPVRYFGPGERLCWQGGLGRVRGADLVVLGQENALLANYPLLAWRRLGGPRLAFFGHGRGFQAARPEGASEAFKRFWASKVDWWFAYTERGAEAVVAAGFPRERITVFNNAIDVSAIGAALADIRDEEREATRTRLLAGSRHVGVFVGGLYAAKRIGFLIAAARLIREQVPDFQLLVIGGGPDAGLVEAAAVEHGWIHAVGPKFEREKALLVSLGHVMLMPGLVGLAVLDAFAYGTPMVTTDLDYHSPEIDYLVDGVNGLMVREADDPAAYAGAVVGLLRDEARLTRLRAGCAVAAGAYSIEGMAGRFVEGVLGALEG